MSVGEHVRRADPIRGLRGEERPEHSGIALDGPGRARAAALPRRGTRRWRPPRRWADQTGARGAREAASVGLLVMGGHHPSLKRPRIQSLGGTARLTISATTSVEPNHRFLHGFADRPSRIPGIERSEREGRVHISLRRVPEEMGSRSRRDSLHVRALGSPRRPGDRNRREIVRVPISTGATRRPSCRRLRRTTGERCRMVIRRLIASGAAIGLLLAAAIPVAAHGPQPDHDGYAVTVLVTGPSPDADLVNGWGLSRAPTAPGGSPTTAPTSRPSTRPTARR